MTPLEMEVYLHSRGLVTTPPWERSKERIAVAFVVEAMIIRFSLDDAEAEDHANAVITDTEERGK
jgi:hypothetical protein